MFKIRFLQGWGRGICGGSVEGGERFCMLSADECNIASHIWAGGSGGDLSGGQEGAWEVMDPSSPRLTYSDFFRAVLSGSTASKV